MNLLDRLAARVRIDWLDFAVTRGGFFGGDLFDLWAVLGPAEYDEWPDGRPPEPAALVASGGYCAPSSALDAGVTWHQWKPWYLRRRYSITDDLPTLRAARGGIRFVPPPSWDRHGHQP